VTAVVYKLGVSGGVSARLDVSRIAAWVSILIGITQVGAATAADLGVGPRIALRRVAPTCPPWGLSTIASSPSVADMQAEVSLRYADAGMNTEIPQTLVNRSPRVVWAFAARNACGIALGHLSAGEVNHQRLWNCECYHARMSSFPAVQVR
jgi:hypothetical protein